MAGAIAGYARPRVKIFGPWGDVRRAFKIGDTSEEAMRRARKAGGFQSLAVFGDATDSDERDAPPVGLAYTLAFPEGYNDIGKYTVLSGGGASDYFFNFPAAFSTQGTGYVRSSTTAAAFKTKGVSLGGFPMLKNAPFSVQVMIPPPGSYSIITLAQWNGATYGDWILRLYDGALAIMRKSAAWTQGDEDSLHTLLAIPEPTEANQVSINTLRAALYDDYTPLDFGGKETWLSGQARTLTLIPEPRGMVRITDGARWQKARHSAILASRQPGTLWMNGPVTVATSGPAFYWQLGYPLFASSGLLKFPEYPTPSWMDEFTEFNVSSVSAASDISIGFVSTGPGNANLTGTKLHLTNFAGLVKSYFSAEFATTNTRYTPFLYNLSAYVPAAERTGSTALAWDSEDYQLDGDPPILEVAAQCEGEMGKRSYTVEIIDVGGAAFELLGPHYDSGQFRVASLFLNDEAVVTRGIITGAEATGFINTTDNQVRLDVASGESTVRLTLCTQEEIMGLWPCTEGLVGDGKRVGGVCRDVLNLAGIPAGDYSAVAANAGIRPAGAVPGDKDWAITPNTGVIAGEFLKSFVGKHGNNRKLWHAPLGWDLAYRPATIAQVEGHDAHFTSDPDLYDPTSYPGRFAIFDLQTIVFDWSEYANWIIVVGAEDSAGNRICQWTKYTSAIGSPAAIPRLAYAGMPRILYIQDDAWRTQADLAIARRSLDKSYFLPPRYGAFRSNYHHALMPGMRITVDGNPARITRISGSSWINDEMEISYRQLES